MEKGPQYILLTFEMSLTGEVRDSHLYWYRSHSLYPCFFCDVLLLMLMIRTTSFEERGSVVTENLSQYRKKFSFEF